MFVYMNVCSSVRAFWPLEPERLVRSGRANIRSMRWSGGKTTVPVADRLVAHDRYNVPFCKKSLVNVAGQTNGQNRLKLGGPIATMGGGGADGGALHTCDRHVTRDFTLLYFAPERLVRLGQERHRSTRKDGGFTVTCHREDMGWNPVMRTLVKRGKSTILTQGNAICNAGL